ncbi:MAG: hypothetical protein ACR2JH_08820 [Solirubrobacteraceae bacterium]
MTETPEHTAQRIADQGREALLSRLRPAFQEAAAAHSDVLRLDDEQLEQLVQRAADRADGLQWRRALAGVATEELGIGLGEALGHPAVIRAQAIVGAPSYEESLAALEPAQSEEPQAAGDEPQTEVEVSQAEIAEPSADEASRTEDESPAEAEARVPAPYATEEPEVLRLTAVHLGGIANLEPAESGIQLRLSEDGLDIARGPVELLGRLRWAEIRSLDVPPARWLRRRRRSGGAQLVIRTRHGDATFEIPMASAEELDAQLAPLRERHLPA